MDFASTRAEKARTPKDAIDGLKEVSSFQKGIADRHSEELSYAYSFLLGGFTVNWYRFLSGSEKEKWFNPLFSHKTMPAGIVLEALCGALRKKNTPTAESLEVIVLRIESFICSGGFAAMAADVVNGVQTGNDTMGKFMAKTAEFSRLCLSLPSLLANRLGTKVPLKFRTGILHHAIIDQVRSIGVLRVGSEGEKAIDAWARLLGRTFTQAILTGSHRIVAGVMLRMMVDCLLPPHSSEKYRAAALCSHSFFNVRSEAMERVLRSMISLCIIGSSSSDNEDHLLDRNDDAMIGVSAAGKTKTRISGPITKSPTRKLDESTLLSSYMLLEDFLKSLCINVLPKLSEQICVLLHIFAVKYYPEYDQGEMTRSLNSANLFHILLETFTLARPLPQAANLLHFSLLRAVPISFANTNAKSIDRVQAENDNAISIKKLKGGSSRQSEKSDDDDAKFPLVQSLQSNIPRNFDDSLAAQALLRA
eukprot:jgi/Bigna1/128601/aug1.7_g3309